MDELSGLVNVRAPVKFYKDEREPYVCGGLDAGDALDAIDCAFERDGDLVFYFFRCLSWDLGHDGDAWLGEVWQYFNGELGELVGTPRHDGERDGEHE